MIIQLIWAFVYILVALGLFALVYWIIGLAVGHFGGPAIMMQIIGGILLLIWLAIVISIFLNPPASPAMFWGGR